MKERKVTVIFQPSGRRGQVEVGKTVLQAARELGVDIESVCGGKHTCGKCRVRVEEGFFERESLGSRRDHLSLFASEESKFIGDREREAGYRLACLAELGGDALIYVPEESRGGKQVILAGAFGSYIDSERAMVLGMFPDCDPQNVVAVGNAAGDGARIALLSQNKRAEADRVAREVEYVELTVYPEFSKEFAEAMHIPRMQDLFPHLKDVTEKRLRG